MRHPSSDKRAAQFMFASPRRAKHVRTSSCAKALARMSYTRGLASFFIVATPAPLWGPAVLPPRHRTLGLSGVRLFGASGRVVRVSHSLRLLGPVGHVLSNGRLLWVCSNKFPNNYGPNLRRIS